MNMRGIAPGLLLAMPQLPDPNFARSVVLMIEHSEEGSLGLVVNRPTDTPVAEVMKPIGVSWRDPEGLVWLGGPVMPGSGWLLHEPVSTAPNEGTVDLVPGLSLSNSPQQLRALAERPPGRLRFLMGYAGWGGGQLEGELARGDWLLAEVSADFIFATPHDQMWTAALHQLGADPATLVPGGGVH